MQKGLSPQHKTEIQRRSYAKEAIKCTFTFSQWSFLIVVCNQKANWWSSSGEVVGEKRQEQHQALCFITRKNRYFIHLCWGERFYSIVNLLINQYLLNTPLGCLQDPVFNLFSPWLREGNWTRISHLMKEYDLFCFGRKPLRFFSLNLSFWIYITPHKIF